jgi:methylamine dehydrogenase accessory protein MauD
MELLILSNVILWVVVIALVIVIYALTRQIGVLYERVAPAGALAINQQIEVGQLAPEMVLPSISSGLIEIGGVKPSTKSQLLFFVSPECPVCKSLLPAIKSSANAEADWIDVVFASDGQDNHQDYIKQQGLEAFPYIISELLGKNFGVAKLPYAVLIDQEGKIASMGIINSREHIDSLFEAKERNVASIQDYMANQNQAQLAK